MNAVRHSVLLISLYAHFRPSGIPGYARVISVTHFDAYTACHSSIDDHGNYPAQSSTIEKNQL
jgi:hypothetical protein